MRILKKVVVAAAIITVLVCLFRGKDIVVTVEVNGETYNVEVGSLAESIYVRAKAVLGKLAVDSLEYADDGVAVPDEVPSNLDISAVHEGGDME